MLTHYATDNTTFNPDFAVDVVARRRKQQRNEQLERFVAFS